MRPIVFVVIFAVTLLSMYLVYNLVADKPQEAQLVQDPEVRVVRETVPEKLVYVAKDRIPLGAIITPEMLDRQKWPSSLIGEGFVTYEDGKAPDIIGMVTRSYFEEREVIMKSKLANPNDPSFLAGNLEPGMRAVTISVNGITSVAGFIYPGDRVDVLLTHTVLSDKEIEKAKEEAAIAEIEGGEEVYIPDYDRPVTEVVLPNVRVLAVDRKATAGEDPNADKKRRSMPTSITLEVAKQDAQRIRLAEREGEVSLVLRGLKDESEDLARPSGQEDLTRTLPPANFPDLYGFDKKYSPEMDAKEAKKQKKKDMIKVKVVRGSEVEEMEIGK